ncbi:hypothetical protein [Bradyrhizobium prioriisuperbiae]|uniref:hypothetical protein n=1 Tax=Bradyrhizobium prioriisuperbiae TaxID=2854389 RepID=UPI0028F11B89|nr:hypothetical protein [Bradyrhizobium prioritasuperba]
MSDAAAAPIAINPDELIVVYETARRLSESGDRAWRMTPGQRIDLHRLITDLRSPGGIAEHGASPEVWINYLAPILAENGAARRLLADVLAGFAPEPPAPQPPEPPEPTSIWRLVRMAAAGALSLAVVMHSTPIIEAVPDPIKNSRRIIVPVLRPSPPPTADLDKRAAEAYDRAMATTRQLLDTRAATQSGVTPRLLAAAHAGRTPQLGTSDTLLVAMLRGWPLPPDDALTADARGITSLKRLTAEIAAMSANLPRVLFESRIVADDKALQPGSLAVATGTTPASTAAAPLPWSRAWLLLAGLPLLLFIFYAPFRFRRRTNDVLERWKDEEMRALGGPPALEGIRQASGAVDSRAPEPFITRDSLRALMRYRPVAGRRLDARRSVTAVLRQAGYAEPVMRRVQRMVDYLVIIQRWQPHDHERLRVRRVMETMAKRGLSMSIYDYERDPLFVRRVVAAQTRAHVGGLNGREELLALPSLRDLHPNARLILVTDGRDLVERITGRVREAVGKGLSFWEERMVLTPVPVGDWGEVEFAMSRDLNVPLGRTTQDMTADLAQGFRLPYGRASHRLALQRARGVIGLAKLDVWWKAIADKFGSGARVSYGPHLLPDRVLLVTDLAPSPESIAEIISDLRRWLGPKGFLWHAGCAIYPQLRFDLTQHIGMHLRAGPHPEAPMVFRDTPGDRRIFERLTTLPWFRTGRMPEWLRREVLAAIDGDDLKRACEVIRALFTPRTGEAPGPLAIWWPRTGALALPPDAVMVRALAGNVNLEPPPVTPEREALLRAAAGRAVLRREAGIAALIAGAGIGAASLVPDFRTSPHPIGAWFPLFVFVLFCLVTAGVCILLRRSLPYQPRLLPSLSPQRPAGVSDTSSTPAPPAASGEPESQSPPRETSQTERREETPETPAGSPSERPPA